MGRSHVVPYLLLFFIAAADQLPAADVSRKHALLVGCTKYDNLDKQHHLQGPGNDVQLFGNLLVERYHFDKDNVVVLAEFVGRDDRRPTRANVEREIDRLMRIVDSGDQVVILVAGHGSQQPDNDPDNDNDYEPDGLDEIFLPADVGTWDRAARKVTNAISDDEMRAWLGKFREKDASVWVVVDSCHSGTMIRGTEEVRQLPSETLIPEEALANSTGEGAIALRGSEKEAGMLETATRSTTGGIVAIYAAQSTEPTVEMLLPLGANPKQQEHHGLLTFTMCQILSRVKSPLTYRQLAQRIDQQYVQWGRVYPTPLVEGDIQDREVLGKVDYTPHRMQLLVRKDGSRYLNAGAIHGLTSGSILAIYPPAGARKAEQPLGHVMVVDCGMVASRFEPCEFSETPAIDEDDLPAGAMAELVYLDYGLRALNVAWQPAAGNVPGSADRLTSFRRLAEEKGSLIRLVDTDRQADWLVCIREDQALLVPASGWLAADSRDGEASLHAKSFGPVPIDNQLSTWAANRLQRIARVKNILSLSEPFDGGRMLGGHGVNVELNVIKHRDRTDRVGELLRWGEGGRTFPSGALISFEAKNLSREAVDVTLLFLDSQFGISPFFPKPGRITDNRILPTKTLKTRRVRVSDDTVGLERMLVIAVKADGPPKDFSWLSQPTITDVARGHAKESPIAAILQQAGFGKGSTRGMIEEAEEKLCIRHVSWRVVK